MAYQLGVDMGATWTRAAVCRAGGGAEPSALGEHARAVPTVVHAGPDGAFSTGETAERRAAGDPHRAVRGIPARVGDPTPVLLGREPVPGEALAARVVAAAVRQVARREGGPPEHVAVTHAAGWGAHKVGALRAALAGHGVGPVSLVPGPVAAVAGAGPVVPRDAAVVVVDLGGSTCDTAVVRGGALLAAGDVVPVGGAVLDEAVFAHVREALGDAWAGLDGEDPAVHTAVARLRRDCTTAREVLSDDTVAQVPVMLPGLHTTVRIGRAEFEDAIRPALVDVVDAARSAAAASGAAPGALLLVGGAARTPLVVELLSAGLGLAALPLPDAGGTAVAGAALLARAAAGGPVRLERRGPAPIDATGPSGRVPAAGRPAGPGRAGPGRVAAAAGGAAAGAAAAGAAGPAPTAALATAAGPGRTPAAGPGRPTGTPAAEDSATAPTAVARPPKGARRFTAAPVPASRRGRAVLAGVLGSVVALGAIGAAIALTGRGAPDAVATTPAAVTAVPPPVAGPLSVVPPLPATDPTPDPGPAAPQAPARTAAPPPRATTTTRPPTTTPTATTTRPTGTTTTTTTTAPTTTPTADAAPAAGSRGGPAPIGLVSGPRDAVAAG